MDLFQPAIDLGLDWPFEQSGYIERWRFSLSDRALWPVRLCSNPEPSRDRRFTVADLICGDRAGCALVPSVLTHQLTPCFRLGVSIVFPESSPEKAKHNPARLTASTCHVQFARVSE